MSKIRDAELARLLNISKASVSLAVNGKPGISDELRSRILQARKDAEKNPGSLQAMLSGSAAEKNKNLMVLAVIPDREILSCPGIHSDSSLIPIVYKIAEKQKMAVSLQYLRLEELNTVIERFSSDPGFSSPVLILAGDIPEPVEIRAIDGSFPVLAVNNDSGGSVSSSMEDTWFTAQKTLNFFRDENVQNCIYLTAASAGFTALRQREHIKILFDSKQVKPDFVQENSMDALSASGMIQPAETTGFICENRRIFDHLLRWLDQNQLLQKDGYAAAILEDTPPDSDNAEQESRIIRFYSDPWKQMEMSLGFLNTLEQTKIDHSVFRLLLQPEISK